ncbi:MAG: PIN domain-containing protein [Pirellulales bacterium]
MIFVDTSAWYAFFASGDANHAAANRLLVSIKEPLVTSDYVVDESLTLFRSRSEDRRAFTFGTKVIDDGFAKIIQISDADFAQAWQIFQHFADKKWSFTDCTSRVVMQRLGIGRAFAFDEHFRQFGTVTVVP